MERREAIKMTGAILGYAVTGTAFQEIMQGCTPRSGPDWQPAFFNAEEAQLVDIVSEAIVPETDTPGARSMGVPQFIDNMVNLYFPEEQKNRMKSGIQAFRASVDDMAGGDFTRLKEDGVNEILTEINKNSLEVGESDALRFFRRLKQLTLLGYFTSEYGASEYLKYQAIPGRYNGCIDYGEIGKSWSNA